MPHKYAALRKCPQPHANTSRGVVAASGNRGFKAPLPDLCARSSSKSFNDGPLGFFSPISHFCTVDELVLSTAANTAWLTCLLSFRMHREIEIP